MAIMIEERKQKRFVIRPVCVNPYPAHLHDVVETVILRRGFLRLTVNGTPYLMQPNDIMMIFPGMMHSYENASEDAEGLFVGFQPEMIEEFYGALITHWPVDPKQHIGENDREMKEAVEKLETYAVQGEDHPLACAYIHLLTACMFTKLALVPAEELHKNSFMYRVMQYVQIHSAENLTLDSVAKAMGVGRSHLSHLFSQKLKINFRKFLNTTRIEKACLLLQDRELSIKEVCYECGFESTRTFHRVFLEEQKMTPGEYRERMSQGFFPSGEIGEPRGTVLH